MCSKQPEDSWGWGSAVAGATILRKPCELSFLPVLHFFFVSPTPHAFSISPLFSKIISSKYQTRNFIHHKAISLDDMFEVGSKQKYKN